ncbi:hypothetical protein ACHAWF_016504, partial [Thalassiosira exigua]
DRDGDSAVSLLGNEGKESPGEPAQRAGWDLLRRTTRDFFMRDHVEVTLRIGLSLVLTYVLTLGSFPHAVPPSQTPLIAAVASMFAMVWPTLMFSVGAMIFPGMVGATFVALLISTLLLAVAAVAGVAAYVVAFSLAALIISGLRFTDQGPQASLLLMLVSLNTMGPAPAVERHGLPFVKGLWTEAGTTNDAAVFCNTLIRMCWISACISFGRLCPPARTARTAFSRKLLPKVLKEVAALVRNQASHLRGELDAGEGGEIGDSAVDVDEDDDNRAGKPEARSVDEVVASVVQDASITINGGMTDQTLFEPRLARLLCQCMPPYDIVALLGDLTSAVNDTIFASLTLRMFAKAGFEEMQANGLGELYEDAADTLHQCADALAMSKRMDSADDEADPGGDGKDEKRTCDSLELHTRATRVRALTNEWIDAIGPGDGTRTYDASSAKFLAKVLWPWIMGAGFGLIAKIFACLRKGLTPQTWQRVCKRPYYDLPKFVWCLKFSLGFTILVCMDIYWPAYANLEMTTRDEKIGIGAHFSGWSLVTYAFSTTQTVEGTWKKSMLRITGTVFGGFSAWLALTITTDPVGLGVWMTITCALAAHFGLQQGFSSRFGLDKDFAWGPGYFSLTQALVVLEVYKGYGGKNDITADRIVSTIVGIAIAMAMAAIPPGVYGNSPRVAKFLLEDKKRIFRDCIVAALEGADTAKLHHLHAVALATFIPSFCEANSNYNDAMQLRRLCILKQNPGLRLELDHLAVLGSSILALIRFTILFVEAEPDGKKRFEEGSEGRHLLEKILTGLDIEDGASISGYDLHFRELDGKTHERPNVLVDRLDLANRVVPVQTTLAHFSIFVCRYIMQRERKLDYIKYGFLGKQST